MHYVLKGISRTIEKEVTVYGFQKPELITEIHDDWETILEFQCEDISSFIKEDVVMIEGENVYIVDKKLVLEGKNTPKVYLYLDKVISEVIVENSDIIDYYTDCLKLYFEETLNKYPKVDEYLELHEIKNVLENIDKIKNICYPDNI